MSSSFNPEHTGFSDLVRVMKGGNTSEIDDVVTELGTRRMGRKTLSQMTEDARSHLEPGTARILPRIIKDAPPITIHHSGRIESMTPAVDAASLMADGVSLLANEVLYSLDGCPTDMSNEDFQSLRDLVQWSHNQSTGFIALTYKNALTALDEAREKQTTEGEDGKFSLSLRKYPFSLQPFEWTGEEAVNQRLRELTCSVLTKHHANTQSSARVTITIDSLVDEPFIGPLGRKIEDAFHKSGVILRHKIDLEESYEADAQASKHTDISSELIPLEDERSKRFVRTIRTNPQTQIWDVDVLLLGTITKDRAITRSEAMSMMPDTLYDEIIAHTKSTTVLLNRPQSDDTKPTSHLLMDDQQLFDFKQACDRVQESNNGKALAWSEIPRDGIYGSLFSAIRDIRSGLGQQVMESRYSGHPDPQFSLRSFMSGGPPLSTQIRAAHQSITQFGLSDADLEYMLPPTAHDEWLRIQQDGLSGGLGLSEYVMREASAIGITDPA